MPNVETAGAQQFVEFKFSADDLKGLPKQHSAYMVATCFAINEILVLLRLTLQSITSLKIARQDERLAGFAFMQGQILTRSFSAKAVEYLKLMKDHRKICERAKDVAIQEFFKKHGPTLEALWDDPTTSVAVDIRNNLTSHIGLVRIRKAIAGLSDDRPEMSFFLHRKDGNSFYLLGEDVAHISAFNATNAVDAWSGWVLETCGSIQKFHHAYMIWVIETFYPDKMGKEFFLEPDARLVGDFNTGIPANVPVSGGCRRRQRGTRLAGARFAGVATKTRADEVDIHPRLGLGLLALAFAGARP